MPPGKRSLMILFKRLPFYVRIYLNDICYFKKKTCVDPNINAIIELRYQSLKMENATGGINVAFPYILPRERRK